MTTKTDIKAKYELNFDDLQKNFQAAYEALDDDPEWEPSDELPPEED